MIFQRLHSRESYAGTGIGLALCKRIVERHGGEISLDTAYAGGARVCFTLPGIKSAETGMSAEPERPAEHAVASSGSAASTSEGTTA